MRVTSLIGFGLLFTVVLAFGYVPRANSGPDAGSCSDCHESVLSERTNHFIDSESDCMFCHETDPTGVGGHVLSYSENDLCLACHIELDRPDVTDAHGGLNCVECHNPHGSDYAYSFSAESISLCSETCHTADQLGNSHAVGDGVLDSRTGNDMTCVSNCHSLHKPKDGKLLQFVEQQLLCGQCHDDKI